MPRRAKLLLFCLGILLLPMLAVLTVLAIGNTAPGRHLAERLVNQASGGQVALHGLSGRFPDALHFDRLEFKDAAGSWAVAENVDLDWSPLRLVTGAARIDRLAAARVELLRQPAAQAQAQNASISLPLRVDLAEVRIARLELDSSLAGSAAVLSLHGAGRLDSLTQGNVALAAERLDAAGRYSLTVALAGERATARIEAQEPAHGLIAALAGLPDLGPLALAMSLDGPRRAEAAEMTMSAGPLTASARGTLDLVTESADLTIAANAPAMRPAPGIAWQSVVLAARVSGPFARPVGEGHLEISKARAGEVALDSLTADLHGSNGPLEILATLTGLHLPAPAGDLFRSAPLRASIEARLDLPERPFHFTLAHPLLSATGNGSAGAMKSATMAIDLPALAPVAAWFGRDLQGRAALSVNLSEAGAVPKLALDGTVAISGGATFVTDLLGDTAKVELAATLRGQDVLIDHVELNGKSLRASAEGSFAGDILALGWQLTLSDLAALDPNLSGTFSAQGRLEGPLDRLALQATGKSALTLRGFSAGTVELSLAAQGLPDVPSATFGAQGNLAGAPLQLAASLQPRREGGFDLSISDFHWKSLAANGRLALAAGSILPYGRIDLRVARLADIAPLIGESVGGTLEGRIEPAVSHGRLQVRLDLTGNHLERAEDRIDSARLEGTIDDLSARPSLALRLTASGIAASGFTGDATIAATGPVEALALKLMADLQRSGVAAKVDGTATLDASHRALTLTSLQAQNQKGNLRLLAPARFNFAGGVAVDHLRFGADQTVLDIAGALTPRLALTASLRNATPALAKQFMPSLAARGTVSADMKLTGTMSDPAGSIRITGRDLQLLGAAAGTLAPTSLDVRGDFSGGAMQLDLRVTSGHEIGVTVIGRVPLDASGALDLHGKGTLDLAILDPVLTAGGRRVQGQLTLDAAAAGSLAAPRISGTAQLAKGEMQDFNQGFRLAGVTARLEADGDTLRLVQLDAKAGPGTITANGTLSPLAEGMPVSFTITARDAQPLSSDLLTVALDADLTLRGKAAGRLDLAGQVSVHRADINIPDSFPPSVAVLNVQKRGARPASPAPSEPEVGLDLTVDAPGQVFVRGHGVDAEMAGRLQVVGTMAEPQVSGGFDLRRGSFDLAGNALNFTSGRVSFERTGAARRLDPTLNFVAQASSATATATLTVSGYADAPKIAISSVPELPQDEALAQILSARA